MDGLEAPLPRSAARRTPARVLVTGGAGFIGSHVVDLLLARGAGVHVLDDLSSGSLDNLAGARGDAGFACTVGSAADADLVTPLVRASDAVFHLAGQTGVRRLVDEPLRMIERNLRPTEVVLAAAAASGVPTLVASSSEVYGCRDVPFRERDPVQPGATEGLRGGYACAKAMGEWFAMAHAHQHGLPVVVARLFNTVGPRQRASTGMVLPRFVAQALAGEPLTVFGDGAQSRCFAHVGEVARALVDLLAAKAAHGTVVNVGSEVEVRVAALAELVRTAAASDSPIVRVPLEQVFPHGFPDPVRRVPCLSRLRAAIGWAPTAPIERIVAELVAAAQRPQAVGA